MMRTFENLLLPVLALGGIAYAVYLYQGIQQKSSTPQTMEKIRNPAQHTPVGEGSTASDTTRSHPEHRESVILPEDGSWGKVYFLPPLPDFAAERSLHQRLTRKLRDTLSTKIPLERVFKLNNGQLQLVAQDLSDFQAMPLAPDKGETIEYDPLRKCLSLAWAPVPVLGSEYVVEIAKDKNFKFSRTFGTAMTYLNLRLKRRSEIFWRVKTKVGKKLVVSDTYHFSILYDEISAAEASRSLSSATALKNFKPTPFRNTPEAFLSDIEVCSAK